MMEVLSLLTWMRPAFEYFFRGGDVVYNACGKKIQDVVQYFHYIQGRSSSFLASFHLSQQTTQSLLLLEDLERWSVTYHQDILPYHLLQVFITSIHFYCTLTQPAVLLFPSFFVFYSEAFGVVNAIQSCTKWDYLQHASNSQMNSFWLYFVRWHVTVRSMNPFHVLG
jgi:hypothetical protein